MRIAHRARLRNVRHRAVEQGDDLRAVAFREFKGACGGEKSGGRGERLVAARIEIEPMRGGVVLLREAAVALLHQIERFGQGGIGGAGFGGGAGKRPAAGRVILLHGGGIDEFAIIIMNRVGLHSRILCLGGQRQCLLEQRVTLNPVIILRLERGEIDIALSVCGEGGDIIRQRGDALQRVRGGHSIYICQSVFALFGECFGD